MFYVLLKCVESAFLTHTLNGVSTRKLLEHFSYVYDDNKYPYKTSIRYKNVELGWIEVLIAACKENKIDG
jgi:hypothetical protein